MKSILTRIAAALLIVFAVVFVFAHLFRSVTVRTYYGLERKWNSTLMQDLEPALLTLGILAPARVRVERGLTFYLDPRDLVPVNILRTGEWQPEVWKSLLPSLNEGSVFLDVGAHIGYFSLKAAPRVGKTGRVVSFEPNPGTVQLLRDNVAANGRDNIVVEPVACTDREQTLELYAAPRANTGASSLSSDNAGIDGTMPKSYSVRGRPIDDVVRELGLTRVDAIKIDVEGAEGIVLRGTSNTLRRFHPRVVMEVVADQLAKFKTTPADLAALMKAAGYNRSKPLNPGKTDWEWTYQDPRDMASFVKLSNEATDGQLISGFYELNSATWRWTAGSFVFALRVPDGGRERGVVMTLSFTIPAAALQKLGPQTLSATVGGVRLAPETFTAEGAHEYRREIPASALTKEVIDVEFSVDKTLGRPDSEVPLGVIAVSAGLVAK